MRSRPKRDTCVQVALQGGCCSAKSRLHELLLGEGTSVAIHAPLLYERATKASHHSAPFRARSPNSTHDESSDKCAPTPASFQTTTHTHAGHGLTESLSCLLVEQHNIRLWTEGAMGEPAARNACNPKDRFGIRDQPGHTWKAETKLAADRAARKQHESDRRPLPASMHLHTLVSTHPPTHPPTHARSHLHTWPRCPTTWGIMIAIALLLCLPPY